MPNMRIKFLSNKSSRAFAVLSLAAVLLCLALISPVAVKAGEDDKMRANAQRALRSGDFERAEQLYRELLAKNEKDADARLGLSQALLKQRRLQDSFDHAARVLSIDPLSARAHALLGAAVLASGDFRLSVEEFRTALTLNDDEAIAIAGLAMVDYYENRTARCVAGLRRAAYIDPNEPDYVFNLGQAAARMERYKEAANAYERFLAIAPRTDADRRARIRGLIDFLRYLGQQGSLYNLQGPDRSVLPFEVINKSRWERGHDEDFFWTDRSIGCRAGNDPRFGRPAMRSGLSGNGMHSGLWLSGSAERKYGRKEHRDQPRGLLRQRRNFKTSHK